MTEIALGKITPDQALKLKESGEPICFKHKGQTYCAPIARVNENTVTLKSETFKARVPFVWAVPKSEWKEDYVSKKSVAKSESISSAIGQSNYEKSNALDIDEIPNSKLPAFQATVKNMGFCMDRMRITRNECDELSSALCKTTFNQDRQCVEDQAQKLINQLNDHYQIPHNRIKVDGTRKNTYKGGDEYGHYTLPSTNIVVYPYTKVREDVVANKTLLETVVHEWGHHYDTKKLNLQSVHTAGFYKRVSKINNQLKSAFD